MDKDKEKQEISLIGRLLSMEMLLLLMGIGMLSSGIYTGEATQLFWGIMIIGGAIALHFVRKKDWKKHWEEQELIRQHYLEKERERKERENDGKK